MRHYGSFLHPILGLTRSSWMQMGFTVFSLDSLIVCGSRCPAATRRLKVQSNSCKNEFAFEDDSVPRTECFVCCLWQTVASLKGSSTSSIRRTADDVLGSTKEMRSSRYQLKTRLRLLCPTGKANARLCIDGTAGRPRRYGTPDLLHRLVRAHTTILVYLT